jgi:hypothetical protein
MIDDGAERLFFSKHKSVILYCVVIVLLPVACSTRTKPRVEHMSGYYIPAVPRPWGSASPRHKISINALVFKTA